MSKTTRVPSNRIRGDRLTVRFTAAELAEITKAANKAGLGVCTYIRRKALDQPLIAL